MILKQVHFRKQQYWKTTENGRTTENRIVECGSSSEITITENWTV